MTPQAYTDLGYEVFPCLGKRPARCSTWPNTESFADGDNVGLVVPLGAVVIDCDRKPELDGVQALSRIAPAGWRHRGPRAATGGNGLHLWFRVSSLLGIGNGRGSLPPGIDVRGGGRGYVVAPPSYHPTTGAQYEWIEPLVPVEQLPPVPDWLLQHLLGKPAPAPRPTHTAARDLEPYLQAAVDGEVQAVRDAPNGTGNDAINRAAFNLGTLAAHGLTYSDAQAAIGEALSGWSWAAPGDERAAWRTFDSGWRGGERMPRAIPDRSYPPGPVAAGGQPPEQRTAAPAGEGTTAPHHNGNDSAGLPPKSGGTPPTPKVVIGVDEQRVNNEAIAALADGDYPDLYQRSGELVRVIRSTPPAEQDAKKLRLPAGTPIVRPISMATLRERLTDAAQWLRYDVKAKGNVPTHPPQWSVGAVMDRGDYPGVQTLRGIAGYPMIRPDGSISCKPGYDAQTGFFLGDMPEDLKIRDKATHYDAEAAAGRLLQIVSDFPFRSDTDRAAFLAYLITPLARAVINGPTPLFVVEANIRGSGKTLLADVAGLALTGKPLPAQTYPYREEELEKVLVSVARYGLPILCFDNVGNALGGPVLDKWLTSTSPTGRILGSNDLPQFDWSTVIVATANNASVHGDTDRRAIYVGLETDEERPELRTGFAIPDLPAHLVEHRGELLSDALTILQAHHAAGCPTAPGALAKGTFEGWASRVRDAVMYAGLPDAERPADDPTRPQDADTDELGALLAGVREHFQGAHWTAGRLIDVCFGSDIVPSTARDLREVLSSMATRGDRPTRQMVGKRLARYRNRWLNNLALFSERDNHRKIQVWRINERSEGYKK